MKKVVRFWQVAAIDALGVLCMIASLLTGWLPGPGGVPLFIIGLSLLAINHEWAKRYTVKLRNYADRMGDLLFIKDRRVEAAYDAVTPLLLTAGGWLLWRHSAMWVTSAGISLTSLGIIILLSNRGRWQAFKAWFRRKR